ncbi:MAG: hypothetical protein BWY79_01238 [Actinobacteria bacterium ADurb.Bin444]|nr:MAG: hypothetical protein BWY79_01238 [Actinobacteria bacterium ADurb.Bin444]
MLQRPHHHGDDLGAGDGRGRSESAVGVAFGDSGSSGDGDVVVGVEVELRAPVHVGEGAKIGFREDEVAQSPHQHLGELHAFDVGLGAKAAVLEAHDDSGVVELLDGGGVRVIVGHVGEQLTGGTLRRSCHRHHQEHDKSRQEYRREEGFSPHPPQPQVRTPRAQADPIMPWLAQVGNAPASESLHHRRLLVTWPTHGCNLRPKTVRRAQHGARPPVTARVGVKRAEESTPCPGIARRCLTLPGASTQYTLLHCAYIYPNRANSCAHEHISCPRKCWQGNSWW